MSAPYADGTFTSAIQVGSEKVFYPFLNAPTKDSNTKGTLREYIVLADNYTPAAALSTDPADNTQYLIEESEITIDGAAARFSRRYCRIPQTQVYYSSLIITKPPFPTNDFSGAYVDSTSTTAMANVWSTAITSDAVSTRVVTGGTFTITYKTSTTAALNYNDDAATIAAAINALADLVTDATTVSCVQQLTTAGTNRLQVNRAIGSANFIGNLSWTPSFTPTSVTSDSIVSAQANFYAAPSIIEITEASHGLATNAEIRWYSTTPSGAGTLATITNTSSNTFTIPTTVPTSVPNPVYYRKFLRTYTPGADRVLAKITESFYLPTITVGITTPEDIPMPSLAINDAQLLALIIGNGTGYQNYDADPLSRWPTDNSPIYKQRLIQIDVDDL